MSFLIWAHTSSNPDVGGSQYSNLLNLLCFAPLIPTIQEVTEQGHLQAATLLDTNKNSFTQVWVSPIQENHQFESLDYCYLPEIFFQLLTFCQELITVALLSNLVPHH